jgi:hypothetical protein
MPINRPQDQWLQPDPYAQLKSYTEQRMKGVWFRVTWSGALLLFFVLTLGSRLERAQKTGNNAGLIIVTLLVLGRFGYYLFHLIKARQDVAAIKRSVDMVTPR